MQRAGGQGAESLHSSNPLGGSTASGITNTSNKSNMPNFSLLGQQLNNFSSSQKQQQHPQNQQPHPQNQSHPSNLISGDSMNFPLSMQSHSQHFSQGHQNQQQPSQAQGSVSNGGDAGGFSGLQQNLNQLGVQAQGLSGGNQHFLSSLQQQHQYQPQGQSVESLMSALTTIQQKISQLQAIVPYMNQNSQMHNSSALQVQQQAAAAISQIAQVAANMFPPGSQHSQQASHQALHQGSHHTQHQAPRQAPHQAPNQASHQAPHQASHQAPHQASHQTPHQTPHQAPHQTPHQTPHQAPHQTPHQNQQQQQHSKQAQVQVQAQPQLHSHLLQSSQQQQQQQLQSHQQDMSMASQTFFGAGVPQGQQSFNFLQGGNGTTGSSNGNGLGNHYSSSQRIGANGEVSRDLPNSSGSLASQMVEAGVAGNAPPANGSGMNVASKGSSGGGGSGYGAGAQNVGGSNGSNVNSTMAALNGKQSSPVRNQVGGGISGRGGSNPDMTHLTSTRAPMPTPSTARATTPMEDRDDVGGSRDDDDDGDNENLAPGSYDLVELDAIEILAEHTHFCDICGKGFKRDANLRMHMRGHGDEYKTPAALARPDKASHELSVVRPRRYSCPYGGCKRNKKHRKFQPLKTMLCVKNHYRRSHCPKILTCTKCKTKKFSVVADLKTHEKHCGCDKWQCSCGTTFSRKDKLIGHIALFVGHKPAYGDMEVSGALDGGEMGQGSSLTGPNTSGNASGYGLSATGNMNPGSQPNMGCGSGMGLSDNSLQGLSSRGGTQGGNTLTMPKDGNVLVPDNSSSSDSFPSAGIPNSMFPNLFNNNYLQDTGGGNASPDGLH